MRLTELKKKENLVFVGGFALWLHGKKSEYTDIDIVVTDIDGLSGCVEYQTDSKFSETGNRAFIITEEMKVDIFIESKLPEFEIINGLKVQTLKSMLEYYVRIYPLVKPNWKKLSNKK